MANATNLTEDCMPYRFGKLYWFVNIGKTSISHTNARLWHPYRAWHSTKLTTMSEHYKVYHSLIEANKFIIKHKPADVPYYDED